MRAVGYVRVSPTAKEDGLGLDVQREGIEKWAAKQGAELVGWREDKFESGAEGLERRAGLALAIDEVRDGRADGLVVYRLDRLARDMVLQEQILADVWRLGGQVWTTMPGEALYLVPDDPSDPSRALIRQVLGAVAQYERAMILARMAGGKAKKAARGGYVGGAPPYGWRAEHRELVEDPEEQVVVARIEELAASGLSTRRIAETLNEGGLLRRGARWHHEQVRRVLARR